MRYLAADEVRGSVISLWPNPTRQTLPPARVAFKAVDMVLLKPTQSKLTSTHPSMAFFIFTSSAPTSCKYIQLCIILNAMQEKN